MKRGRFLCCGTDVGLVELRDPRKLSVEITFKGSEGILDLDVSGNTLITTGYGRQAYM